mgnify:FL=1
MGKPFKTLQWPPPVPEKLALPGDKYWPVDRLSKPRVKEIFRYEAFLAWSHQQLGALVWEITQGRTRMVNQLEDQEADLVLARLRTVFLSQQPDPIFVQVPAAEFPTSRSRGGLHILTPREWKCLRAMNDLLPFKWRKYRQPFGWVANCHYEACDVYIGRGGPWGNPFILGKDGSREEVLWKYERWIGTQPDLLARLPALKGKVLGCWCAPKPWHGDVLLKLIRQIPPAS